jgi:Tfp pilus assembly protein PilE
MTTEKITKSKLREGAEILLEVAEMQEHNEAIFKGRWKNGSKAWSGEFIDRLSKEGMAKVQEALTPQSESVQTIAVPRDTLQAAITCLRFVNSFKAQAAAEALEGFIK